MTPTRRFRSLCLASLLAGAAVSAHAAPAPVKPAPAGASPSTSAGTWGTYGIQTQWIDPAVKPGNDFDAYVSGKWNAQAQLPPDKTRIGSFIELGELSEARMHDMLDGIAATRAALGTDQARIGAAYSAFMNTQAIDAAGLAPAKPYLDAIAAVSDTTQLMRLFATAGYSSPLGIDVSPDPKASDRYALGVGLTGLGLPDRNYYLSAEPRYVAFRDKYLTYLTFLLGKAGYADAAGSAKAVLALETKMAQAEWDREVLRDPDLTYNKVTTAELAAMPAGGLVQPFLEALGPGAADTPFVVATEIPPTPQELSVAKIDAAKAKAQIGGGIPATLQLIADTPIATWRAYLVAHFLSDHGPVLPNDIDAARFAFYGTVLSGQPQQRPRWKRGVQAVEDQIGDLTGKLYAAKYYPPAEKAAMEQLVANLRTAMGAELADLSWMSADTRQQAAAKLAAFNPKIGEPTEYKTYDGLTIKADTPLANQVGAEKWQQDFDVARVAKPVDRAEWHMFPQTVNAYYNPSMNEIVFPAAILQPPFFNLAADPAVNYGAIGAVIGHEMGHGFDDEGAKYDGTGNLRDWWTAQDKANFEKLQDKLAAQYSAFCPFDDGKTCVNGRLTMGENIGDMSGLALAYRAYQISLGGKPAPVINGTTGDQRFFLAWAQVWRGKTREEQARQYLVVDPHSPERYRANGAVRNFDAWYKAFDVKPGDALYLPPEQRVKIW